MATKKKPLNLYETSNRLDVPPGWLRQMALAGKIPCLRIGRRKLRFDLDATRQAIARLATGENPAPSPLIGKGTQTKKATTPAIDRRPTILAEAR